MPYCPYVPTCPSNSASARALAFLTLPASRFFITVVFINIKSNGTKISRNARRLSNLQLVAQLVSGLFH